ncbi:MAG: type II secretion system F family protein [Ruminococcaceae bacterium]|nr:type II secretion system F family protein [Oscillospiraceae bacterium]MBQ3597720.1 type II secretion system F family protein [Clostridia bacterium]
MQKFKYTAVNLQKQKIKGTFIANDENDLAAQLAKQSLFLISCKAYTNDTPSAFFTLSVGSSVSTSELTNFCRQFSIMQNTGISILDCLDILRNQHFSAYFRNLLQVIYEDVKSGLLLSDALDKHRKVFPHFFRSMVRVGELSGKMELVFGSLADYYESEKAIKAKVKGALSYPLMLLAMTVGVVILMMLVVVPTFREAMAQMDVEITGITKIVYDLSDFMLSYWLVMLAGVITIGLVIFLIGRTESGAFFFDKMVTYVPFVRTVQRNLFTARFARAFGLLLSSGMDLNSALDSVEVIISNRYLKKKFHEAAESVRQGMSITVAFETYKLFPQMMLQMVTIGERSGTLDEVLMRSCLFFDNQVETSLNSVTSKIQPIMLLLMGGIIGTLFIAVYSPILNIMTNLNI